MSLFLHCDMKWEKCISFVLSAFLVNGGFAQGISDDCRVRNSTGIGKSVFFGEDNLKSIVIPATVQSIGFNAFRG